MNVILLIGDSEYTRTLSIYYIYNSLRASID